jgi:hypothetical protein
MAWHVFAGETPADPPFEILDSLRALGYRGGHAFKLVFFLIQHVFAGETPAAPL